MDLECLDGRLHQLTLSQNGFDFERSKPQKFHGLLCWTPVLVTVARCQQFSGSYEVK